MKIYVSKKDENVTAKLDESYSNEQTVILDYLTGPKTGKNICITISTLKRWWKQTEIEDTTEDINETDANLELLTGRDSKEQAETPVDIMKVTVPVVEVVEKSVKKTKKVSQIDRDKEILELDAFIRNTYNYKYYESVKCYKITRNDKTIAEVYPQKKKISCYFKSLEGLNLSNTEMSKDGYKYYLPARVDISYDIDFITKINLMIQSKED